MASEEDAVSQHEIYSFFEQSSVWLSQEYERIRKDSSKDPGTAGDEGEENWAELLRSWLPDRYTVTTKGRIIGSDGESSRQMDVVVLGPNYPPILKNRKKYLAAEVLAAFECKNTLKKEHLPELLGKCVSVKSRSRGDPKTVYQDVDSGIIYGMLAHSHSWKSDADTVNKNISETLYSEELRHIEAPYLLPDLLCVADLASWRRMKFRFSGTNIGLMAGNQGIEVMTSFPSAMATEKNPHFNAIGATLAALLQKLAMRDPSLRPLADYYRLVKLWGEGQGGQRRWGAGTLQPNVLEKLRTTPVDKEGQWSEWRISFG